MKHDNPADKWHNEAFSSYKAHELVRGATYELLGQKIQSNLENVQGSKHILAKHGDIVLPDVPRTFNELKLYFEKHPDIEGVIFHKCNDDGSIDRVKIKGIDFGVKRVKSNVPFQQ